VYLQHFSERFSIVYSQALFSLFKCEKELLIEYRALLTECVVHLDESRARGGT